MKTVSDDSSNSSDISQAKDGTTHKKSGMTTGGFLLPDTVADWFKKNPSKTILFRYVPHRDESGKLVNLTIEVL